jgi:hypothetical protein
MADNVDFNPAPPPDFNPEPPPSNPEKVRAILSQNSPDPPQVQARLNLAGHFSEATGISPSFFYENSDALSEHLYGKIEKPASVWEKFSNTIKAIPIERQMNQLAAREYLGDEEAKKQMDELGKSLPSPEKQIAAFPKGVIDTLVGLGFQLKAGLEGMIGGQVGAGIGMLIMGPTGSAVGGLIGEYPAAKEYFGQLMGSLNRALLSFKDEQGHPMNPTIRRVAVGSLGAIVTALNFVQIGRLPGVKQITEGALIEGAQKALLNGKVGAVIANTVLRWGTAATEQAAYGLANGVASTVIEESAKELSNRVDGTTLTHAGVKEILSQWITAAGVQGTIGGIMAMPGVMGENRRLATEDILSKVVRDAIKQDNPELQLADAQQKVELTKEARQSIAERKTALGEEAARSVENLKSLREQLKTAKPEEKAAIEEKLQREETNAADLKRQVVLEPERLAEVTPENPLVGDVLRLSEKEGEQLDRETQSVEQRDLQDPEIKNLNVEIEGLQSKVAKLTDREQATLEKLRTQRETARNRVEKAITEGRSHLLTYKITEKAKVSVRKNIADLNGLRGYKWPTEITYDRSIEGGSETVKIPVKQIAESILSDFSAVRHTQKTMEGLATLADEIQAHPDHAFPARDLQRIRDLEKRNWRDLTREELQNVRDGLMHLKHLEQYGQSLRRGDQVIALAEARQQFDQFVKGHDAVVGDTIREFPQFKERLAERLPKIWDLFSALGHQDMLWSAIDKLGERGKVFQFMKDVLGSESSRLGLERDWKQPFLDWSTQNKININKWANEKYDVAFTRSDGTRSAIEMRRDTAMSVYMHWQNENNRQSLIKGYIFPYGPKKQSFVPQKLSEVEWQQIVDSVTPQEKEYIGLIQDLTKKTGEAMNAVYERMHGYPMEVLQDYWRKRVWRQAQGKSVEELIAESRMQENMIRAAPDHSMTIERTGATQPLYLTGATEEVNHLLRSASLYTAMAEPIYNAQKVAWDPVISNTIEQRVGTRMLEAMRKGLKDDARMREFGSHADRIVEKYRQRGVLMFLGFNPSPVLKNLALSVRSLSYVPFPDWIKGVGETLIHPRRTEQALIAGSSWYDSVKQSGALKEISDVLGARTVGETVAHKIRNVVMAPLKWASKTAVKVDMNAGINQFLREAKRGALTEKVMDATGLKNEDLATLLRDPDATMQAAIKYGQFVAQHGHATNLPELQSGLQRGGTWARLFTTFQSEPNANLNMMIRSFMDAEAIGTPGAYFRAAKTALIVLAAEPLIMSGIQDIVRESRGQKTQAPWWDVAADIAGLVYGGKNLVMDIGAIVKRGYISGSSLVGGTVVGQIAQDAEELLGYGIRSLFAAGRVARAKASTKFVDTLLNLVGMRGGLPYKAVRSQTEGLIKILKDVSGTVADSGEGTGQFDPTISGGG